MFEEVKVNFSPEKFTTYPKNFDVVKKNTFDKILDDINNAYGINIGKNLINYEIIFFNNRLVIRESNNIYICSKNEKNEIDVNYMLISNTFILLKLILTDFFDNNNDNFEQYFVNIGFDIY